MGVENTSVYMMIDGVQFGTENPKFPNCARVLGIGVGPAKKLSQMDFQVKGGSYQEMSAAVNTGRVFARATILTVDPGGGETENEAKFRYQTLFDVIVVKYKFSGDSSFTLSFSRSDSRFAWVPLVFSPTRFEDQLPTSQRNANPRQPD
jgi:hypothetical protein